LQRALDPQRPHSPPLTAVHQGNARVHKALCLSTPAGALVTNCLPSGKGTFARVQDTYRELCLSTGFPYKVLFLSTGFPYKVLFLSTGFPYKVLFLSTEPEGSGRFRTRTMGTEMIVHGSAHEPLHPGG
jgi:hypothetical protein